MDNVLIISDTQAPYHHPDTIAFLSALRRKLKPVRIVHVGDEVDHHTASKYLAHPSAHGAQTEYERALEFLDSLERLFPTMELCNSNHGMRIAKAAARVGIYSGFLKSMQEVYRKPKWTWSPSVEVPWARGTCEVYHGQRKKGAIGRAKRIGQAVACGHWHSLFGVEYYRAGNNLVWGMDVGCLVDEHSPGLAYAEEAEYQVILGCGAIVDGWPKVYPMETDVQGRWTGRIV